MVSMYKLFCFMYNWFLGRGKQLSISLNICSKLKKPGNFHLISLFIPVIRAKYPLTHNFIAM